jgi:ferredoxin
MGYRITMDNDNCISCGVCMDVRPVQALDMSRPDLPGVESGPAGQAAWVPARSIVKYRVPSSSDSMR